MERDWRCQKYGPLGWLESIIKILAIGVGIASLGLYSKQSRQLRTTRIIQISFMVITGVAFIALIALRVLDKELFALGFMILQVIGHWIMTAITIVADPRYGQYLFTYVFLMILGEYVKLMFLFLADNVEVRFLSKPMLLGFSVGFVICFLIILIVQVIIWLIEY